MGGRERAVLGLVCSVWIGRREEGGRKRDIPERPKRQTLLEAKETELSSSL
jgi:hypothetical protein